MLPSDCTAIVVYPTKGSWKTLLVVQEAPSSQDIEMVPRSRDHGRGFGEWLSSSTLARGSSGAAFGKARMIWALSTESGRFWSDTGSLQVCPPSVEWATLRKPEPSEARELSMREPSESSTTLFSSMPVPVG